MEASAGLIGGRSTERHRALPATTPNRPGSDSTYQSLASKWINDEHFSTVIPSAPKITSGKVVARSNGVTVS
jgi:hypothetical protein